MTEKRFYKVLTDCVIQDTLNNELVRGSRIAGVMNVLYEENEQLQSEISKLTDLLGSEIEKNARLLQEINSLKIENMRLKELKE